MQVPAASFGKYSASVFAFSPILPSQQTRTAGALRNSSHRHNCSCQQFQHATFVEPCLKTSLSRNINTPSATHLALLQWTTGVAGAIAAVSNSNMQPSLSLAWKQTAAATSTHQAPLTWHFCSRQEHLSASDHGWSLGTAHCTRHHHNAAYHIACLGRPNVGLCVCEPP